jgi:hypothetical protein
VRRLIVWFLFFQITRVVCAGLGDDGDKIEDAYGSPIARRSRDDGTVAILYHKDRYLCQVTFEHGISVSEEYSRFDRADLSEKEIARFLKRNAGPKVTWIRADATNPAPERRFERSDQQADATIVRGKDRMILRVRVRIKN